MALTKPDSCEHCECCNRGYRAWLLRGLMRINSIRYVTIESTKRTTATYGYIRLIKLKHLYSIIIVIGHVCNPC